MTDVSIELEALQRLYGRAIPPLPRQPRMAFWNVACDATLDEFTQAAANDRRFGYQGRKDALVRHAVSLFLMALAKSAGEEVSAVRFQMEVLRQQREAEDYTTFVNYAQTIIKETEEYGKAATGRGQARALLKGLIALVGRHPTPAMRMQMQGYLTTDDRFVKLVRDLGDEGLKSWLELAT